MSLENALDSITASINNILAVINNADDGIKEVIFNDPCTIVNWKDGGKTVVRCQGGDVYDKRTGLLLCIAKRAYGNRGRYNDVLNKWAPEE